MSAKSYYHNVRVFNGDLQPLSIFVGPGSVARPLDEAAAARLVEGNLDRLTGGRGGHIMPVLARPSPDPPKGIKPTRIDGFEFYVLE